MWATQFGDDKFLLVGSVATNVSAPADAILIIVTIFHSPIGSAFLSFFSYDVCTSFGPLLIKNVTYTNIFIC